jgi:hypothetical protein
MLRSTIVWAFRAALRVQKSWSMNSSSSSSSLNGPISSSQERLLLPLQRLTPHSLSRRVREALATFVAVAKCFAQAVRLPPPDLGDQQLAIGLLTLQRGSVDPETGRAGMWNSCPPRGEGCRRYR